MTESKKPSYTKPLYVQLIIGAPGSGKTTYCYYVSKFLKALGRNVAIVNLDPANENMDYKPDIDIMNLITLADVMESEHIGPNGGLMYCIEYLEKHFEEWFMKELNEASEQFNYFIVDCPGQVELYTHHQSMARIFQNLQQCGYNTVTVNLIDSHYCSDISKFVSALLLSLNMMLNMGLPHVNVLSKADLLKKYEENLPFNIDYYTEVLDLSYLLESLDSDSSLQRYQKLNRSICSMVEDYSLVSFQLLDVENKNSMLKLRNIIDKANGYAYNCAEEQYVNTLIVS